MEQVGALKNWGLVTWAALGSLVANTLGGWTADMKVLVFMMGADYLTGVLVAALWQRSDKSRTGALDSKAGFRGLCKKGVILLLVWLGVLLDEALGVSYVRTAVILFFLGVSGLIFVMTTTMPQAQTSFYRDVLQSMVFITLMMAPVLTMSLMASISA